MLAILLNPWARKIGIAVAAFAAMAAIYAVVTTRAYERGASDMAARYEAQIEAERQRVAAANTEARRLAEERVAQLIALKEERDALRRKLAIEAAQDPDAGRTAIGSDSVRRLNEGPR